jgi:hypothetical protein
MMPSVSADASSLASDTLSLYTVTVMAYPRYQMLLTRLSNRVARAGMQAANMVNKENMMPMAAAAYE